MVHTVAKSAPRAFSIMELMVVVALFSVISLVVLANHSKFNSSVLLGSLAYNIALSIREAQVYGLSVQGLSEAGAVTNFQGGYGVHFAGNSSYVFFADKNANRRYDGTPTDEIIKTYTLSSQHTVSRFCAYTSTNGQHCSDGTGGTTIAYLDVVFLRPDPDASMVSDRLSGYSRAEIRVSSRTNETRVITVASTGQISVATAP